MHNVVVAIIFDKQSSKYDHTFSMTFSGCQSPSELSTQFCFRLLNGNWPRRLFYRPRPMFHPAQFRSGRGHMLKISRMVTEAFLQQLLNYRTHCQLASNCVQNYHPLNLN